MAEPNYCLCDICGEPVPKECRLRVFVGRSACPSGNGYLDDVEYVDLCHEHAVKAIGWFLPSGSHRRPPEYERGKNFVEWVRKQEMPV